MKTSPSFDMTLQSGLSTLIMPSLDLVANAAPTEEPPVAPDKPEVEPEKSPPAPSPDVEPDTIPLKEPIEFPEGEPIERPDTECPIKLPG